MYIGTSDWDLIAQALQSYYSSDVFKMHRVRDLYNRVSKQTLDRQIADQEQIRILKDYEKFRQMREAMWARSEELAAQS